MLGRRVVALLSVLLMAFALPWPAAQADRGGGAGGAPRPVVFVHGFSGSGGQFETQARRLTSNGYPAARIEAHEYDSTFQTTTPEQVYAALDRRIARLRSAAGADAVDLVAHSLGTGLMQTYLRSSPERAASVAHYVNLDGASSADPPGGVPTLAVWGEGDDGRAVGGARNVRFPGQSHTQAVTSASTFTEMYRFFTGAEPRTTAVVPQRRATLAGRAVLFPSNEGAAGARLEVYEVDPRTGARRRPHRPVAAYELGADGAWGPFRGRGAAYYEFALVQGSGSVHHLYFPPFRRSDHLVRLLTSRPGEGVSGMVDVSDRHVALTVSRQKEWWGDQGAAGDSLRVDGLEVLNAANSPRAKRVIGIFAHDSGSDGVTDLSAPIPEFHALPFLTGVDVHIPAGRPRHRPVTLASRPRGEAGPAPETRAGGRHGRADVLRVPAWPSSTDRVSVQFDDY